MGSRYMTFPTSERFMAWAMSPGRGSSSGGGFSSQFKASICQITDEVFNLMVGVVHCGTQTKFYRALDKIKLVKHFPPISSLPVIMTIFTCLTGALLSHH